MKPFVIGALFLLFGWKSYSQTPSSKILIGEVGSGQQLSYQYLQDYPVLGTSNGWVRSFTTSYKIGNEIFDKSITGNNFSSILPQLKELPLGSKIYFDNILISFTDGTSIKKSAYFVLGSYTLTHDNKIYIDRFLTGSEINLSDISNNSTITYIDPDYEVVGFAISGNVPNVCLWERVCLGNKIPQEVFRFLSGIPKGQKVYFDNIKIKHKTTGETRTKNAYLILK